MELCSALGKTYLTCKDCLRRESCSWTFSLMASTLYAADRFSECWLPAWILNITCSWEISDDLLGYLISPCWVFLTPDAILGYHLLFLAKPSGTLNFLPDLFLGQTFQNSCSCSFRELSVSCLDGFFSTKSFQDSSVGNHLSLCLGSVFSTPFYWALPLSTLNGLFICDVLPYHVASSLKSNILQSCTVNTQQRFNELNCFEYVFV